MHPNRRGDGWRALRMISLHHTIHAPPHPSLGPSSAFVLYLCHIALRFLLPQTLQVRGFALVWAVFCCVGWPFLCSLTHMLQCPLWTSAPQRTGIHTYTHTQFLRTGPRFNTSGRTFKPFANEHAIRQIDTLLILFSFNTESVYQGI